MHHVSCLTPLKAEVAGAWAVAQHRHSQLQCDNTVNLKVFLLQSIYGIVSALWL